MTAQLDKPAPVAESDPPRGPAVRWPASPRSTRRHDPCRKVRLAEKPEEMAGFSHEETGIGASTVIADH